MSGTVAAVVTLILAQGIVDPLANVRLGGGGEELLLHAACGAGVHADPAGRDVHSGAWEGAGGQ